jgi:geranylgeranyl pyrophosphate synthase
MHIATLVHDQLQRSPKNARFATSVTVLAGDFAFAAASQLAAATNRIVVMRKFSETLQFIVKGKITKMFNNGDGRDQEAYYRWVHAKTAALFELAAGMAATLGSASSPQIETAYQFGYNTGMAYRITRDILDFTVDSSQSGKPVGHNLRQGIITLPTLLYLNAYSLDLDIASLAKTNGNGQAHIEDLICSIRQSEFIEQAANEASRFLQRALEALAALPDTPERAELARLAQDIVSQTP